MKPRHYLETIISSTQTEIKRLYNSNSKPIFIDKATPPKSTPFAFSKQLQSAKRLHLIAELKKASPSKGLINPKFNPLSLASTFQSNGASCLSILTEPHFFKGDLNTISMVKSQINIPVLRKDFILDEIQVWQSRAINADAILIILAILDFDTAQQLLSLANQLALDVIIEVHTESELHDALSLTGTFIIGINNRDLSTFDVNLDTARHLFNQIKSHQPDMLVIAESGYSEADQIKQLQTDGFSGVLIGEGLVINPSLLQAFAS
jgi:indole-3-glycerol phosphate synthase